MTVAPKPTVRHNPARAELGECFCPRCAPHLHAQAELPLTAPSRAPEASPPPAEAAPAPLPPPGVVPPPDRVERVVVGGYAAARGEAEARAEVDRVRAALRAAEARWLAAYGALVGALDVERCEAATVRALQRDLRAATSGLVRLQAADRAPVGADPALRELLSGAQCAAVALVSAMAEGPDWRALAATQRRDLERAFEALDRFAASEASQGGRCA
jgi:hypothetical protein